MKTKNSIEHLALRFREGCDIFALSVASGINHFVLKKQLDEYNKNQNRGTKKCAKKVGGKRDRKAKVLSCNEQGLEIQKVCTGKNKGA